MEIRSPLRRKLLGSIAFGPALGLGLSGAARAQDAYPSRVVRLVCGQAAGTGMDTVSRLLAFELGKTMGQQLVVENKTGAGGNIGANYVAKSPPDGYTLFMSGSGSAVINPFLLKQMPFRFEDLVPVTLVGELPLVVAVSSKSGFTSLGQLVEAARTRSNKLNHGTPGVGSPNHLAAELFNQRAKIETVHIPYRTVVAIEVMSGTLDYTFDAISSSMPHIKAGNLRALAVTSRERSPSLPDVPTVAEQGFPGFDMSFWYAVLAPALTPAAIVKKLNGELVRAARLPELSARFSDLGMLVRATSPEDAQSFMNTQYRDMGTLIKSMGIKPE